MITPFIQYSPDFTKVTGTEGVSFEWRTIPVYIGRRSRAAQKMTTEKWKYLRRDTNTEFVVNEALAEIGDPRLTGEVNQYRGLADVKDTLDKLMREATQQVNEIMQEAVVVETELNHCCKRLELADAVQEISDRFRRSHPLPIPPRPLTPERTPLPPRTRGPNEMPMLARTDSHHCQRTCHDTYNFSFSFLLFITCTFTVGHMTDALYFRT